MSTYISDLISRSLTEVGDPDGRRTTRVDMLLYFNRVQELIATVLRCVETDYYFNLIANEPRYAYPDDNIQISLVRISRSSTPTSLADYYSLREKFKDEWRSATDGARPSAQVYGYFARPAWFELLDAPVAAVTDGGIVTTWNIPAWTANESASATMALPDWLRGQVQEGMMILSRKTGRERAAAMEDWKIWTETIEALREKVEDKSDDRRPAIRPPGYDNPFMGMR